MKIWKEVKNVIWDNSAILCNVRMNDTYQVKYIESELITYLHKI